MEPDERDDAVEEALDQALARLRNPEVPPSLRANVEATLAKRAGSSMPRRASVLQGLVMGGLVVAAAAGVALTLGLPPRAPPSDPMVIEAANDYVRVLISQHPVEIESGGIHQVKPWFEGRLDFAPIVPFAGDDDFPLQGGAVAYFLDRKAATFVFKRRLHLITLFVFRADGLAWAPATPGDSVTMGHARAKSETTRGIHTLLWRDGDLGYALVSDVDPRDLTLLGSKIAP